MKNKNILLVISKFPPEYSGPGVRIPRFYKWFEKKGYNLNLDIVCNGVEQIKNENYIFEGFLVRRITAEILNKLFLKFNFLPQRLTRAIFYQYEFVKSLLILSLSKKYKNTDFLHVAGHSGGTAAALVWAQWKKIPVLMELVTDLARHKQSCLILFSASIPDKGTVITLTEKKKQECMKLGLPENKIWCRPNPINDKIFTPSFSDKYKIRTDLTPFTKDEIVISNVGKMIPQKNHILIVKILPFLPEKFVAVLAGPLVKEGPLYERDAKYITEIKAFIKENNLQKRVHFVPEFVQMDQYMKLADVYVMPAWNEGFGTPMLEAMGCGVPVVANKEEAAFQEWIKEGENGYLCDVKSPQKWAQAIEKTCDFSNSQCLDMAAEIHKKAGQEGIYTHYERIIKGLLEENN